MHGLRRRELGHSLTAHHFDPNLSHVGRLGRASIGVLALLAVSCTEENQTDPITGLSPLEGVPSVVSGALDLLDVTTLSAQHPMRERSRAAAFFAVPEMDHWCSAVLIAPDAIVTAAACAQGDLRGAYAAFRRETGIPQAEWQTYSCAEVLLTQTGFSVVRCASRPGDMFGVVELSRGRFLAAETEVYLVQQACDVFQNDQCEPTKRLSRGLVKTSGANTFNYDADALPGALGGPVFERSTNILVGVHAGGSEDGGSNIAILGTRIAETLDQDGTLELGRQSSIFGGPPLPPDPFEPNQDEASATDVGDLFSSVDPWIAEDDLDVYRVEADVGDRIRVQLEFSHALGDIDLAVRRDSLEGPRVASAVSATDDELITYQVQRSSSYYVVVFGYQGATNAYTINLEVR